MGELCSPRHTSGTNLATRPGGHLKRPSRACGSSDSRYAVRSPSRHSASWCSCWERSRPGRCPSTFFLTIDIPVVVVVWNYPGLSAEDMESRVTFISERAMSTSVERHLADRLAVDRRHGRAARVLRAGIGHRERHRADHVDVADGLADHAAGYHAAGRPAVQRDERARRAAHALRNGERAAALRLGAQLPAHSPLHDPGPVYCRRRTVASSARSWSRWTRRERRRTACRLRTSSASCSPRT